MQNFNQNETETDIKCIKVNEIAIYPNIDIFLYYIMLTKKIQNILKGTQYTNFKCNYVSCYIYKVLPYHLIGQVTSLMD